MVWETLTATYASSLNLRERAEQDVSLAPAQGAEGHKADLICRP